MSEFWQLPQVPSVTTGGTTPSGFGETLTLIPTPYLRWLVRRDGTRVLQRLDRSLSGKDYWSDVPEVREE